MTNDKATWREGLGAALRQLDVPEHGPGFYSQLHERLAEERLTKLDIRPAHRAATGSVGDPASWRSRSLRPWPPPPSGCRRSARTRPAGASASSRRRPRR